MSLWLLALIMAITTPGKPREKATTGDFTKPPKFCGSCVGLVSGQAATRIGEERIGFALFADIYK